MNLISKYDYEITLEMKEFLEAVHGLPIRFSFRQMDKDLDKEDGWTWSKYVPAVNAKYIVPYQATWFNTIKFEE